MDMAPILVRKALEVAKANPEKTIAEIEAILRAAPHNFAI